MFNLRWFNMLIRVATFWILIICFCFLLSCYHLTLSKYKADEILSDNDIGHFVFTDLNRLFYFRNMNELIRYDCTSKRRDFIAFPANLKKRDVQYINNMHYNFQTKKIHVSFLYGESMKTENRYFTYDTKNEKWFEHEKLRNKVFNFVLLDCDKIFASMSIKGKNNYMVYDLEKQKITKIIDGNARKWRLILTNLKSQSRVLLESIENNEHKTYYIYDPINDISEKYSLPYGDWHSFNHIGEKMFICTKGFSFSSRKEKGGIFLLNFATGEHKVVGLYGIDHAINGLKKTGDDLFAFVFNTGHSVPLAMGQTEGNDILYRIQLDVGK